MWRVIKTILIVGLILALLGGGGFAAYSWFSGKSKAGRIHERAQAKRGDLTVTVAETGTIKALRQVDIKSKIAGQIDHVLVDVGDRVTKGQLLMQLDTMDLQRQLAQAQADHAIAQARLSLLRAGARPEDLAEIQAQLRQAEATFKQAKAEFDRSQAALKTQTITQRDWDNARNAYENAKGQVEISQARLTKSKAGSRTEEITEARTQVNKSQIAIQSVQDQIAYASIRSPIAGTIIERGVEVGSMVSPGVSATAQGTSLLKVADLDSLLVASELNQIDVGKVSKELSVDLRIDAIPDQRFKGKIWKVAPAANADKKFPIETLIIKQGTAYGRLKPGMTTDLDIQVTKKSNVLYLPVEAVVRGKGNEATVTLPPVDEEGKESTQNVQIGMINDHQVEILSGLKEGQEVLIKPASSSENTMKF